MAQDTNVKNCDLYPCTSCGIPMEPSEYIVCQDCGETFCRKCLLQDIEKVKCNKITPEFKVKLIESRQCVRCFRAANQTCSNCGYYILDPPIESDDCDTGHCARGNPTDDIQDTEQGDCDMWEDKTKWQLSLVPKGLPKKFREVSIIKLEGANEEEYGYIVTSTDAEVEKKVGEAIAEIRKLPLYDTTLLFDLLEKKGVPVFAYDFDRENF